MGGQIIMNEMRDRIIGLQVRLQMLSECQASSFFILMFESSVFFYLISLTMYFFFDVEKQLLPDRTGVT